ncbi:MAG TPA: subclass B3 metallo-beta-lactamase [Terriglobales bacterium]|nr:subclass B3 metallo-beta-lactamase [Terriglobales bacterium]
MRSAFCLFACLLSVCLAPAQSPAARHDPPEWTAPFPPFRIAGNLYYVGSQDLASYLVVTPQGNILINSATEANVPLIRASIEKLGFRYRGTRILLISHAHWDHAGGSARILRETGAKYLVMDADVPVVESGGRDDFAYGSNAADRYPPAKVDRALHDGDVVRLGGTELVAHLTPGHTKGCTTWAMRVTDHGKTYYVVIVGSASLLASYRLRNNPRYPRIVSDYERTFRVLASLPCDIFLGSHGGFFDLKAKYAALGKSAANPFVDPDGYRKYVAAAHQAFEAGLAAQRQ